MNLHSMDGCSCIMPFRECNCGHAQVCRYTELDTISVDHISRWGEHLLASWWSLMPEVLQYFHCCLKVPNLFSDPSHRFLMQTCTLWISFTKVGLFTEYAHSRFFLNLIRQARIVSFDARTSDQVTLLLIMLQTSITWTITHCDLLYGERVA